MWQKVSEMFSTKFSQHILLVDFYKWEKLRSLSDVKGCVWQFRLISSLISFVIFSTSCVFGISSY